jgi:hypothetical protein
MKSWWKRNVWTIVVLPTVAALILVGVGLLRGYLHRRAGFDPEGRPLNGQAGGENNQPREPPPRTPIGVERLLTQIAEDLQRADAAERPHLRYLSLVHRHDDPAVDAGRLDLERRALSEMTAALAPPNQTAEVVAIDAARCIYRLDLRRLDWTSQAWREIALVYPYGLRFESSKDAETAKVGELLRQLSDEPPVWVRGDWWVAALARPPLSGPGGIGLWTRSPPPAVKEVLENYRDQAVDSAAAVRELQLSDAGELRRLIEAEPYLRDEFGLAPLLRDDGSIPRDAWESRKNLTTPYQELSKLLGRGMPLVIR